MFTTAINRNEDELVGAFSLDTLRQSAAERPDRSARDCEALNERFTCYFEPIYRRQGQQFVPAGQKAFVVPKDDSKPDFYEPDELSAYGGMTLFRALESGVSQIDVIACQLDAFAAEFRDNDKLCFEVSAEDLSANPENMMTLRGLIEEAADKGIPPSSFVLELSSVSDVDRGDLYSVASELRAMQVHIALTGVSPDCLSLQRIQQIQPLAVKFTNEWCDQARIDPGFTRVTKSVIDIMHAMNRYSCFIGVRSAEDLAFVHECGFIRCQGPYFGSPKPEISRGAVYAV